VLLHFVAHSGELTPAQALDMVTTKDYVLIDVRTDKDKAKAGVPQLPSNAKNKLISLPYAHPSLSLLIQKAAHFLRCKL
jgi:hypothetical protein